MGTNLSPPQSSTSPINKVSTHHPKTSSTKQEHLCQVLLKSTKPIWNTGSSPPRKKLSYGFKTGVLLWPLLYVPVVASVELLH
ncbi:hypothetical protein Tco_0567039 [Tanacetum coccineum]